MNTSKIVNLYIPLSQAEIKEFQFACNVYFSQNSQKLIRRYVTETLKTEKYSPKYKLNKPTFIQKMLGKEKTYTLLTKVTPAVIEKPLTNCMTVGIDSVYAYLLIELCAKKGIKYHECLRAYCLTVIAAKREFELEGHKKYKDGSKIEDVFTAIIHLNESAKDNNRYMKTKHDIKREQEEARVSNMFATATWR